MDLWDWIARDDAQAADRMVDRIGSVARLLADNPRMGRARPEIADDLRSFGVGRWVILYRAETDGVTVVRCVHGARDLDDLPLG